MSKFRFISGTLIEQKQNIIVVEYVEQKDNVMSREIINNIS